MTEKMYLKGVYFSVLSEKKKWGYKKAEKKVFKKKKYEKVYVQKVLLPKKKKKWF